MDGRDILREWRGKGQREPVLILTARDALAERVEGLRLGADDYLCKPFALIEVAAGLEALMRRTNGGPATSCATATSCSTPANVSPRWLANP